VGLPTIHVAQQKFPNREARPRSGSWQARRVSNPQPSVLETDALPIELLA
jgi:hypothetical protein